MTDMTITIWIVVLVGTIIMLFLDKFDLGKKIRDLTDRVTKLEDKIKELTSYK